MPIFNIYGPPGSGKSLALSAIEEDVITFRLLPDQIPPPNLIKAVMNHRTVIIEEAYRINPKTMDLIINVEKNNNNMIYFISQSPLDIPVNHVKLKAEFVTPPTQET